MTMMKKEYCKPETRNFKVGVYFMLMASPLPSGGGNNPIIQDPNVLESRGGGWDDYDEDLLQDMDREELKELE